MRSSWLQKNGADCVIVFCNGWGMDCIPFLPLVSYKADVLILYNFQALDLAKAPIELLAEYPKRILIGWSMGVWAGQKLFAEHNHLFSQKIAVNGTLCPIDDRYGIPRNLFQGTLAGWSELARSKFYYRLCGSKIIERQFLLNSPGRELEDQKEELAWYLKNVDCLEQGKSIYETVVVSGKDRIVPTSNQIEFWGQERVIQIEGSHFPFYRWNSWDEMLQSIQLSTQ